MQALEPRKKPRQQRSRVTVDAILAATARVLIDDGYDRASTNRIAEVAGVSVGSLYQYFRGKEELVTALARRHADEQLAETSAALAIGLRDGADLEVVVRTAIRGMIAAHRIDPELHIALMTQVLHLRLEPVREIQDRGVALVRGALEAHRERLRPRDLDVAAWLVVTTVEAAVHAALIEGRSLDDPAIERELCDLVLRYLLP